jgi:hypothetical protein
MRLMQRFERYWTNLDTVMFLQCALRYLVTSVKRETDGVSCEGLSPLPVRPQIQPVWAGATWLVDPMVQPVIPFFMWRPWDVVGRQREMGLVKRGNDSLDEWEPNEVIELSSDSNVEV